MCNPVLEAAHRLVHAGVSVIPIGRNKRPAVVSWKPFQVRLATAAELEAWFSKREAGIAIIAGAISGHTEILDFDDIAALKPWHSRVEGEAPGLVSRLVVVITPTGGRHIYYRCATIEGNTKLAVNLDHEVMIETRGEGGYALIPPSPAWCHPDRQPYVLRQGDLADIPTITADERHTLLHCARALNAYVEPERVSTARERSTPDGDRPGDRFAARVSWEDILLPHGWRVVGHRGEVTLWRRPGKQAPGASATTNYAGSDVLYVFSSNASPFGPETAYTKFAAYAWLEHGGDFHAAARMLASKGYRPPTIGGRVPPLPDPWLGPRGRQRGIPLAVRRLSEEVAHG
jgi:Bifunctional DNA primase/polymerase, N-terminal